MQGSALEWTRGGYVTSTDQLRIDLEVVQGFLSDSYWARGISADQVGTAIDNSLCFGLYAERVQIGFARVISDGMTLAYLADVFVLPSFRGKGLGRWLVDVALVHPALAGVRRSLLATRDAHGLYHQVGFKALADPAALMERRQPVPLATNALGDRG